MANETASAPYNFVALPPNPVKAPVAAYIAKRQDEDKETGGYIDYVKDEGKYSGSISYAVENITPLYIGDEGRFFAPDGTPRIPGSSMRGLLKNVLKIISCGTMRAADNEDLTSRHLYFRSLASRCKEFNKHYAERLMSKDKKIIEFTRVDEFTHEAVKVKKEISIVDTEGGFLARDNGKFTIYPADKLVKRYPRKQNAQGEDKFEYRKDRYGNYILDRDNEKIRVYDYIVNVKTQPSIIWDDKGAEMHTGSMGGKGHYYRICNPDWSRPIEVPDEIIQEYQEDKNRTGLDLLKEKGISGHKLQIAIGQHFDYLVPCFYKVENGVVRHFGFGKFYRIPYNMSIEDHIPKTLRDDKIVDFADAIFGRKEAWASRIFVGDAAAVKLPVELDAYKSHNLMEPNPTSFQLYLQQDGGLKKHWDDESPIRGYKLYWHKNITSKGWHSDYGEEDVDGTIKIKPVDKGARFEGTVRFNNLSQVELGAILAVFQLGDKGTFKLGMGKPIGMGSVKITHKLSLIAPQERYGRLFAGASWEQGLYESEEGEFVEVFKKFMRTAVEQLKMTMAYDKLLKELDIMMAWENTKKPGWNKTTAYMPHKDNRYTYRVVLKQPEQIVTGTAGKA